MSSERALATVDDPGRIAWVWAEGRPTNPPPGAEGMDPKAEKLRHFGCVEESKASLKCIEKNYNDPDRRSICQPYFDRYKDCKQEALDAIKRERIRKQKSAF